MRKQITDRPSYLRAHRNFDDLQDLLGNLQGKLSEVSKDVDKEFLASYRVHMLSIQSEIKTLREDVDKGVQALKSDGNVAKLELEVNWFVEECTRLRLHYTTMENDFVQMQSRFKAMMEQKVYMNEQLKAILKRNRVLEAEIEHALKHNLKIKKTEEENEAAWEAANNIDDQGAPGATAEADNAADMNADAEPELPPDNFYHEQLRRLSAKSPLSTAKFVPTVSRSAKGSKTGSRTGSRDSSRDGRSPSRSRAGSPLSPQRPGALNATTAQTALRGSSPGAGGGDAVIEGEGEGDEELDDFQRNDTTSRPRGAGDPSALPKLRQSSSLPQLQPERPQKNRSPGAKDAAGQQSQSQSQSQRIPKQEVMPVGTARLKERLRSKQQRHNQEELNTFLKHKSPAEASLERAIADIFEEVRARKICAAKRGAIKRFPVHFMGGSVHEGGDEANNGEGGKMVRKRSGGAGASTLNASSSGAISSAGGRGQQQQQQGGSALMPGTALGRRLAGEVSVGGAQGEWTEDGEGGRGRLLAPGLAEEEADLLRQPLIKATGGISGLGVSQLSDNDKFSCVVKYLLDFDRFKEVVTKLQQMQ